MSLPKIIKHFFIAIASIAFISTIFPWFFAYQGSVFGMPVSLRGAGDILGILLALYGICLFFSAQCRQYVSDLERGFISLSGRQGMALICFSSLLYFIGTVSYKLKAQQSLGTHAFDLGFFSNICWNTSRGNWFLCSLLERNFMGVHVNWILQPLSIFYRWGGDARVLLTAQSLFISLTIPILWAIIKNVTGSSAAGFLGSLLFVCSPYIGHLVGNDFHPDSWQAPCLMLMLWVWIKQKRWMIYVCAILALLAKEDVSFILAGFGLFLFLRKDFRWTGALLFVGAVSLFIFQIHFFIPHYIDGHMSSLLFKRYPFLGSNFEEMIRNLFTAPYVYWRAFVYEPLKFWRLLCMIFPTAGLALLSPTFLIPPLISVLPHIFSQASTQLSLAEIYALPPQLFIFVGAAFGARKLMEMKGLAPHKMKIIAICIVTAGLGLFQMPKFFKSTSPQKIAAFERLETQVPPTASVAAQHNLLPHFSNRRYIQIFPLGFSMGEIQHRFLTNPDYIVCDRNGNPSPFMREELVASMDSLEQSARYEKIFDEADLVLFKRKVVEELAWKDIQLGIDDNYGHIIPFLVNR